MGKQCFPIDIIHKKGKEKITMLTAYDFPSARLVDAAGIDIVLVGDSVGNVVMGLPSPLSVTLSDMLHVTKSVSRGVERALVVADMPYLSYELSDAQAMENAGRFLKEAGAYAVKMEIGPLTIDRAKAVVDMGIPVMGHLGFTPQSMYQKGGYKVQGRGKEAEDQMLEMAEKIDAIGCFSVVLEMVPQSLSKRLTDHISIPTIGIGAGLDCDGQVLVFHDVIGFTQGKVPSFVKPYAQVSDIILDALKSYKQDVEQGHFPGDQHVFD